MDKKLPSCELCGKDWYDETAGNLIEEVESIQEYGRCISCKEEFGDTLYPDQI